MVTINSNKYRFGLAYAINSNTCKMATSQAVLCPLCAYLSPSLVLHVSHLRLVHASNRSFRLSCNIEECTEEFRSFSSYNSHVYRKHRVALGLEQIEEVQCDPQQSEMPTDGEFSNTDEDVTFIDNFGCEGQDQTETTSRPEDRKALIQKESAGFLLSLIEEDGVSQVAINKIVRTCRKLCQQSVMSYQQKISDALLDENTTVLEQTKILLTSLPEFDPFQGIDSAYLLQKFCEDNFNFVVSCACASIVSAVT